MRELLINRNSILLEQYITRLEQTKLLYTKCKHSTPRTHLYSMCVFAVVLYGEMYTKAPFFLKLQIGFQIKPFPVLIVKTTIGNLS